MSDVATTICRADVIIPVYDQPDYTRLCLDSIQKHTRRAYRLIVIDNGSGSETKTLLREYAARDRSLLIIENECNVGFTRAANQGLASSDAKAVVLLNNDTTVTDGWLEGLLLTANSDPTIGIVGPRILDPRTDLIRCIGGLVFHKARISPPPGQGCARNDPRFQKSFDCQYVEGSCMLITRQVLHSIGLLDEVFSPGYYEDADYCFRAREAGFRVVYSPHSEIYHHVGGTANELRKKDLSLTQAAFRNDRLFKQRWSHRFEP